MRAPPGHLLNAPTPARWGSGLAATLRCL